jgi:universal stress protein E
LIEHDHQHIFTTVEDMAKEVMSTLVLRAIAKKINCKTILRFGVAWEELAKESATGHYDLVVVGTRAKARASSMLFGNTSQKLLRYCPSPVWIVNPAELRDVRDVAIATDLSVASMPALNMAVTVARAIEARLHVIHVVEFSDSRYLALAGIIEEQLDAIESRLSTKAYESVQDQLYQTDFRTLPHGVKIEILSGATDAEIPEYVTNHSIDLLVIGTHGHSGLSGLLLGNTAERILPGLRASLLAVKPAGYHTPVH